MPNQEPHYRPAYTIHAMNGGEVSPRFEARQDQNKYLASLALCKNWVPMLIGGIRRREGSIFVAKTKFSGAENNKVRFIRFLFSVTQAYVCEFGDLYVRFYRENDAGNGMRIDIAPQSITGITQANPAVVTYSGADNFINGQRVFISGVVGMTQVNNLFFEIANINISANTFQLVGINSTGYTAYTSGGTLSGPFELATPYDEDMLPLLYDFQSADVKDICSDGTINIYRLERTAIDTFTLIQDTPAVPGVVEDAPTGTELGGATLTLSATSGDGVTVTASGATFLGGDIDRVIESGAGVAIITSVTSSTVVVVDIIAAFASVGPINATDWNLAGTPGSTLDPSRTRKGLNIDLQTNLPTFRSADVGKFVAVYGGFIKITRFQNASKVFGHVYTTLRDAPAPNPVATLEWTMYRNAWTSDDGFPTCGAYFQNRRFLCRDETIWGSVSSDFVNFALGSGDGDGINSTISDNEINPIVALAAINKLNPMTAGQIFTVTASSEGGPLTPNDFNVAPTGSEGAKRHVPIRALNNIIYLQVGGRSLRELSFNFVDNKYKTPDLLRVASHICEFNSIKLIDYQGRPDSIIWALREDGRLFLFVYERNEDVVGWARFETGANDDTDGVVQSICVIPRKSTGHDWVWLAVNREINGVLETYVEYLDPEVDQCREWREAMTDSAVFTTATDFVISGLDHLEGETVWVIGDGMLFNATQDKDGNVASTAVVTGGEITVDPQISGVQLYEVGLHYESEALTLEPVIPNELGGPLMARGWEVAAARFRRTAALKINQEKIPLRLPSE
jgi:hypothetical protein